MTPAFANRIDAAHQLAAHQHHLRQAPRGVVLAVTRGGVPMRAIVAKALGWPLEVVLAQKIGHPTQPEYAVDAVSLVSVVLTPGVVLPVGYLNEQVARIRYRPLALGRLQVVADEVLSLLAPPNFQAVSQFYEDFTQVTDEEVIVALYTAECLQA